MFILRFTHNKKKYHKTPQVPGTKELCFVGKNSLTRDFEQEACPHPSLMTSDCYHNDCNPGTDMPLPLQAPTLSTADRVLLSAVKSNLLKHSIKYEYFCLSTLDPGTNANYSNIRDVYDGLRTQSVLFPVYVH